jgi:O-antigen ligase
MLFTGLVDVPRQVSVGPISLLGLTMVACILGPGLLWLARPRMYRSLLIALAPLLLYIAWSFLTIAWSLPGVTGVQNLLTPVAFCVLAELAFHYSRKHADGWWRLTKVLLTATGLAVGLYGLNIAAEGLGSSTFIGARTFALFALLGLSVCLAGWRYGWKPGLYGALLITLIIGLSLSRMALAIAIVLFLLAQLPSRTRRGGLRLIVMAALLGLISFQLVTRVEPIRERFMEGDTTLQVGGLAINATGRTALWNALLESHQANPIFGQGADSGGSLINQRFPGLGQAHSDYLRIMHDHGLIGLLLWSIGMLTLLVTLARGWLRADQCRDPAAPIHLAAILALCGVALAMATDNPMIYVFVMAPFGILVGSSLGAMRRTLP